MTEMTLETLPFDIKKYLTPMGGNRYHLKAEARFEAFKWMYKKSRIENRIFFHQPDFKITPPKAGSTLVEVEDTRYAIIKSRVDTGDGRIATGHTLHLGRFDDNDYMAKAATGAMARAVRHVGINTNEVITRLQKGIDHVNIDEVLEKIGYGKNSYEYVTVDNRLLLMMQEFKQCSFSLVTEIVDFDIDKPVAKEVWDKEERKNVWVIGYGYACVHTMVTINTEHGPLYLEGIDQGNGLELNKGHWLAKVETNSIGRALGLRYNTIGAKEFEEKPDDISDSPIEYHNHQGVDIPQKPQPQQEVKQAPASSTPAAPKSQPQPQQPQRQPQSKTQQPKPQPQPQSNPAPKPQPQLQPRANDGLKSKDECIRIIRDEIRPQLSTLEFNFMNEYRQEIDPTLKKNYKEWSIESCNTALDVANEVLELKKQAKADPQQRTDLDGFRNIHGAPVLEELCGNLMGGKRMIQLTGLETEYLLLKLRQIDFFCALARAIDRGEIGTTNYPWLLDNFDLASPLEFMYKDPSHERQLGYIEYLCIHQNSIDPMFFDVYQPQEVTDFFAKWNFYVPEQAS